MFFTGDVALPFAKAINYRDIPVFFQHGNFVINLEGTILADAPQINEKNSLKGVYNDLDAFREFNTYFPVKCAALANNHIFDEGDWWNVQKHLDDLQCSYIGAGENINAAMRSFILHDGTQRYRIFNAAWKFTGAQLAGKKHPGVFPYEADFLFAAVDEALKLGDEKIIFFLHWNFELSLYPLPMDREIAKELIDRGCYAVIGCHSHRIQGIEFYKGHPIVYGLGNFAFAAESYVPSRNRFPEYTQREMVFEIAEDGKFFCHYFYYNSDRQELKYENTELAEESELVKKYAPFIGYSDEEYLKWYQKNKTTRFFLPTLTRRDNCFIFTIKQSIICIVNQTLRLIAGTVLCKLLKSILSSHR